MIPFPRRAVSAGVLACVALAGCRADETAAAFADAGAVYTLEAIDGAPLATGATLTFPAPGRISGQGPCNAYSAPLTVPYPWFEIGPVAATKMACPGAGEPAFFAALGAMAFAEVQGDTLILSNEAGREMVFRAR